MLFVRPRLQQHQVLSASDLAQRNDGDIVRVAGLVLVRQRPGTAKGICFMTIEDETGTVNVVIFEKLFQEYRKEIALSKLIMIEGKLQKEGEIIHVIAERCFNASKLFLEAKKGGNSGKLPVAEASKPGQSESSKKHESEQLSMFPKGRNFR